MTTTENFRAATQYILREPVSLNRCVHTRDGNKNFKIIPTIFKNSTFLTLIVLKDFFSLNLFYLCLIFRNYKFYLFMYTII